MQPVEIRILTCRFNCIQSFTYTTQEAFLNPLRYSPNLISFRKPWPPCSKSLPSQFLYFIWCDLFTLNNNGYFRCHHHYTISHLRVGIVPCLLFILTTRTMFGTKILFNKCFKEGKKKHCNLNFPNNWITIL